MIFILGLKIMSVLGTVARVGAGVGTVGAAVQTGAAVATIAGVAGGAYLAYGDASNLYNSRQTMANQFQQQSEFPSDLTTTTKFYMSFLFQAYEKRAINNSPFLRSTGTIRLPIPEGLKDNTAVTYSDSSLGPLAGAVLESASTNRAQTGSAISSLQSAVTTVGDAFEGFAGQFARGFQDTGVGGAVRSYFGMTVNPYQTILFERPQFKSHSFSWKLIPKNETESGIIRDIINTFQYHSLPGVSDGIGLLFSFPSMVTVSLYPSSEFLYRFKPAVIESISVNYAPGSSPSFYRRTNAPTAVTITVQLKEIEYWTNRDYTANRFNDNGAEEAAGPIIANQLINTIENNRDAINQAAQFSTNLPG